jgi:hypothetical protein
VATVGADAALLCCAAGTVLNAANYAPPAILKITQKYKTDVERHGSDPDEFWKLWIDPHEIQNLGAHNGCLEA